MADITEFVVEPGRQDIVMIRAFDAPPEVVFRVVTDPELIPRWWGPHSSPPGSTAWRSRWAADGAS
ncbi:hypothetical protein ACFQYP_09045 [Nonomuraea antimicrobica]